MQLNGMACIVCYRVVDVTHVIRVHVILYICMYMQIYIYILYDGLSKCLFPVLLINRNSMRAASCLPLKKHDLP